MADNNDLLHWLDACPTPFHVVRRAADTLSTAGFTAVERLGSELPARATSSATVRSRHGHAPPAPSSAWSAGTPTARTCGCTRIPT